MTEKELLEVIEQAAKEEATKLETHPFIEEQKLVWRSGVVLNKDETRAEVIENYNQREIKVRVSGNHKKELLAVVNHELEKIHNSFEALQYQTLVPCNCQECVENENPYAYALEKLRKRLSAGKYQIECDNSYEMVDVRRLIDDVNLSQVGNTPLLQQLESERSLNFTGKERKKIFDAIISAYPIKINLEMMVNFELEEKLDAIAGGENIQEIVFNLIEWAESNGKLKQLVKAAHESNPGNTELKKINLDGL